MSALGLWFGPGHADRGLEGLRALHGAIPGGAETTAGFLVVEPGGKHHRAAALDALPRRPLALGLAFREREDGAPGTTGRQPVSDAAGGVWIALDGWVLEPDGGVAEAGEGAAIVLAAWERWAEGAFERLEGRWALAIVDLRRRRLVLATDRLGTHPLHWAQRDGRLAAGSEARLVLAALGGRPQPNRALASRHLRGVRQPLLPETFFAGVHAAPPGSWAGFDLDAPSEAPRFRAYWRLSDHHCGPEAPTYGEALERTVPALARAVERELSGRGPSGALLSGGLDSSTLVALAARRLGRRLPTFSFGFPKEGPEPSEIAWADEVRAMLDLDNHATGFDAAWIRAHTDRALEALEEPPMALAALAQYRIYALAAEHGIRVLLDGQGADEIFGGGLYHQRAFLRQCLGRGRWLTFLTELRAIARRKALPLTTVVAGLFVSPYTRRLSSPPDWLASAPPHPDPAALAEAAADRGRDPALLNRVAYAAVRWGNSRIILGYSDRVGRALGVSARTPYYDRELVELVFGLPDHYKVGDGLGKRLLRDVARRYLPASVTERAQRLGFATPESRLLGSSPLREDLADSLGDPLLSESGLLRAGGLARLRRDLLAGEPVDLRAVWRIHALVRWSRSFDVSW